MKSFWIVEIYNSHKSEWEPLHEGGIHPNRKKARREVHFYKTTNYGIKFRAAQIFYFPER